MTGRNSSGVRFWLMKTEPDTFSFDDLIHKPGRTAPWDGVRNYQARNMMRDEMQVGDRVLIYHSSCEQPGVVGFAEVVRPAEPDPTAMDPESKYFDPQSVKAGASRWCMVSVRATARLREPVTLAKIRDTRALETMLVLRRGMRLSIQPVTAKEWGIIEKMGQPEPL